MSAFHKVLVRMILFLIITSPVLVFPQQKRPPDRTMHHEIKQDEFLPTSPGQEKWSPAYRYSMNGISTVQVNVNSSGQNILNDAANEPSIAIDRNNPNRMVIGWRQFNTISSNFRQAGYAYTTNGGLSWNFPGLIEPGVFRSDPVLGSDAEGNFYYNSLTSTPDYMCKVFKSSTGGASWNSGSDAKGGDKQWMTIDRTNSSGHGNIYAYWTSSFSICYPDFFTRSTDKGASFQQCTTIPDDPYWGTLAVGPSGELYVTGSTVSDFMVAKSLNAKNPLAIPTWTTAYIVNLDGSISYGINPNPGGLGGQVHIAVDTSGGINNGSVYVLCSVSRYSNSDPSDVMFVRSTNGGLTWSTPKKINDDPGITAYQWFGTMSVAPNGRIDVVWLDTRDHPGTNISALYYSKSTDGGITWSANQRMSDYFDPHLGWPQQNKMGDYFHMVSDITGAHLAWAATFNGEQDVYYSYISDTTIVPVELTGFTAAASGNSITLNWSTATEINNYGFEIQRSTDRKSWSSVGFVKGNGTSSELHHYSYSDRLMETSLKLYYRLKQLDFNGSFEFSEIAEIQTAADFSLSQNYPNPFNPVTTIKYQVPVNGVVSLKVYNVLGDEISSPINEFRQAGTYEIQFNGNELSSGVYFYRLQAGEYSSTKRMILMK